ncbi:WD40 repeat-like protein [Neoconidiobolus thromboides FSU 785]|nr:WD40 repeat-like protein [Neoconidiobolus thromboides FSU 785]
MSISNNTGVNYGTSSEHFFQTDRDIENTKRIEAKKKLPKDLVGQPIEFNNKILALEKHPSEDKVFLAHAGNIIRYLNLKTEKTIKVFKGHQAPVTCIKYFQENGEEYLLSGSWDKKLILWNVKENKIVKTYSEHNDFVKCVNTFIKDGKRYLISGSSDKELRIYPFDQTKSCRILKGHKGTIEDIKISIDNDFIYTCSGDLKIIQWNIKSDYKIENIFEYHLTTVYKLFLTEDEIWSSSGDKTVKRYSLIENKIDTSFEHPDHVRSIYVTEDNRYCITGGRDEIIRVFDVLNETLLGTFNGHWDEITAITFINKDQKIISASLDGSLRSWLLKDIGKQPNFEDLKPLEYSKPSNVTLTEEEEKELEDLLSDD